MILDHKNVIYNLNETEIDSNWFVFRFFFYCRRVFLRDRVQSHSWEELNWIESHSVHSCWRQHCLRKVCNNYAFEEIYGSTGISCTLWWIDCSDCGDRSFRYVVRWLTTHSHFAQLAIRGAVTAFATVFISYSTDHSTDKHKYEQQFSGEKNSKMHVFSFCSGITKFLCVFCFFRTKRE